MSEQKRILDRLSKGEISAEEAEKELRELDKKHSRKGTFWSFCDGLANMDICIGDGGRIVLEEEVTGALNPGLVELELAVLNGSICVETWDSPDYRLVIKKRIKASCQEEAEALAREYKFVEVNANTIKAGDPQCAEARRRISTSLHLQLPKDHGVAGNIKTENGSVKLAGLDSQGLQLSTSNGSIHLDDISGGPLAIRTVNGSINTTGRTSQVEARTTNGNVVLNSTALSGDARLSTVNGSIKVAVPTELDTAFAVTASTVSGRVSMEHSLMNIRKLGGFGGKHIETRSTNWDQAGKKVNLELSTVNGSIGIRETDCI